MLVGRDSESDISLTEGLVSRTHARLEQRGEEWVVLDLGSTNLTRVNGDVVAERVLRHGDELRFARAKCRFLLDGGPDVVASGVWRTARAGTPTTGRSPAPCRRARTARAAALAR